MKLKNSGWWCLIFFLLGSLLSYILCQFQFFEIDTKVEVVDTIISVITLAIGFYIATSLYKFQTRSLNLHNYLQPKLDQIWGLFLNFNNQLTSKDQFEIIEITRATKELYLNMDPLKLMFVSFGINKDCLDKIEKEIEALESFIIDNPGIHPILSNVVNISSSKQEIKKKIDKINISFSRAIKNINNII